jgi:hypothetical protein
MTLSDDRKPLDSRSTSYQSASKLKSGPNRAESARRGEDGRQSLALIQIKKGPVGWFYISSKPQMV